MESLQDKIAKRAYELFLARGGQHGYHIEDWSRAEKEIMSDKESQQKTIKAAPKVAPSVDVPVSKQKTVAEVPVKTDVPKKAEASAKPVAPVKKKVAKKKAVS